MHNPYQLPTKKENCLNRKEGIHSYFTILYHHPSASKSLNSVSVKNKLHIRLAIAFAALLVIFACSKSKTTEDAKTAPFPSQVTLNNCLIAPDYGSSVICPAWRGPNNDHKIKPKNDPGPGKYYAWPQGLVIDQNSGEINVTKSETGARYIIGFVKTGNTDTCFTELVVAGVTYVDSVYVLESNDTLALPHFNANPSPTSVCDASDDTDYPGNGSNNGGGNDKCEFDDGSDDDNGNGAADEPPSGQRANDQKVRVRTVSGIINLKKTLADGAFGSNPKNGDSKEVTIYYRLNDCSVKALQKIKVNLTYYEKKSDIPVTLMNDVRTHRTAFMEARIIAPDGKPRPPQIFVTRYY